MPTRSRRRTQSQSLTRTNKLYEALPLLADPVPAPYDWVHGIPHHSSNTDHTGHLWHPLRAMHSRKMHYLARLDWAVSPQSTLPLVRCFPDTNPATGGMKPICDENLINLMRTYNMTGPVDWVKHVFTLHDGEVRLVGEESWAEFSPYEDLLPDVAFWSPQLMTQDGAPK